MPLLAIADLPLLARNTFKGVCYLAGGELAINLIVPMFVVFYLTFSPCRIYRISSVPLTHLLPLPTHTLTLQYTTLNTIQSTIYPTAYSTSENMLVCAPTGAGKTDVALLAILGTIKDYTTVTNVGGRERVFVDSVCLFHFCHDAILWSVSCFFIYERYSNLPILTLKSAFKIIYIAPMKALATEITAKFGKKLAWLGIKVRELTGDTTLSKSEIKETSILVLTPEKWDVVTRKGGGDGELVGKVCKGRTLLIIFYYFSGNM